MFCGDMTFKPPKNVCGLKYLSATISDLYFPPDSSATIIDNNLNFWNKI
jgi:hypothetical protein